MLVPKIDIHVHTTKYEGRFPSRIPGSPVCETFVTPENLIKDFYSKLNIDHALLLPLVSPEGQIANNSLREIYSIVRDDPAHFSWFTNIDPRAWHNSTENDFAYMLNYYKDLGAKGVGEMTANMPFDHPLVYALFKGCEETGMPFLFHMTLHNGGDYGLIDELGLPKLEKALQDFPKLTFIGHSQAFWAHMSADIDAEGTAGYPTGKVVPGGRIEQLMDKYENLYCDLSAGSDCNSIRRDLDYGYAFIEKYQDRVFYGTDICSPSNITNNMLELASILDKGVESGKLSQQAYEKVSRKNAMKLLDLK